MKKLIKKVYVVMYRVYNCDQEGSNKAKPFDFIDFGSDDERCIFETSGLARALFNLLLIFAK